MRVLIIHNYYRQRGGEDIVFEQEQLLLKQFVEVDTLTFKNLTGWRGLFQFLISIWNVISARKLKKAILRFHPDCIHIHNWHYAAGPILIRTAKRNQTPIIHTLHNHRLLCPSATLFYKGELFTDSIKAKFPWKAVKNGAYRDSVFQSFWIGFIVWFHKKLGTWKMVDKYITLSDFTKDLFIHSSLGVSHNKFITKINFIIGTSAMETKRENHFLFVGRLSREKGIDVLLKAFDNQEDKKLCIAGEGPLKEKVLTICNKNKNIHYLGFLNKSEVLTALQRCTALIIPSVCYECGPLTLIEAFSLGTPAIVSKLGPLRNLVKEGINGLLFDPNNVLDLIDKIEYWQSLNETEKDTYLKNVRMTYENSFNANKNLHYLKAIYEDVVVNYQSTK